MSRSPNPLLQRTRAARSPQNRQSLGGTKAVVTARPCARGELFDHCDLAAITLGVFYA
jgi:hypothetical protein